MYWYNREGTSKCVLYGEVVLSSEVKVSTVEDEMIVLLHEEEIESYLEKEKTYRELFTSTKKEFPRVRDDVSSTTYL